MTETIAEATTDLTRAVQRFESSTRALLAMYGSTSILVVPRKDFAVHAQADHDVHSARQRLASLEYRARCEERAALRRSGWSSARITAYQTEQIMRKYRRP